MCTVFSHVSLLFVHILSLIGRFFLFLDPLEERIILRTRTRTTLTFREWNGIITLHRCIYIFLRNDNPTSQKKKKINKKKPSSRTYNTTITVNPVTLSRCRVSIHRLSILGTHVCRQWPRLNVCQAVSFACVSVIILTTTVRNNDYNNLNDNSDFKLSVCTIM